MDFDIDLALKQSSENPFYYIDYAISYFGALAIWQKSDKNLDTFKEMAKVASYYPLDKLIDRFDISNPFDEESVKQLSLFLKDKLKRSIGKYIWFLLLLFGYIFKFLFKNT